MSRGGSGYSYRGYYILCPMGVVRARVAADLPVGIYSQHILKQVGIYSQHVLKQVGVYSQHILKQVGV